WYFNHERGQLGGTFWYCIRCRSIKQHLCATNGDRGIGGFYLFRDRGGEGQDVVWLFPDIPFFDHGIERCFFNRGYLQPICLVRSDNHFFVRITNTWRT